MYSGLSNVYGYIDPWKKYKRKRLTQYRNMREFENWFNYLANIYLNTFEWKGFPETVNTRVLEEILFCDGKALFFEDSQLGYLTLYCAGEGRLNVYYEFTAYRAMSNNYSKVYQAEDCVLMRENQTVYPPLFQIETYAARIADSARAIEVYAKTMKKPWLVLTDIDQKDTFQTMMDKIDDNEIAVYASRDIDTKSINAFPNTMDGNGLMALWRNKHEIQDELFTFMGINNANTEKRERLLTDEVNANNQLVRLSIDYPLDWRKKAAEEINEKYGLNVTVDIKHNYIEEQMKEGESDAENDNTKNGTQ